MGGILLANRVFQIKIKASSESTGLGSAAMVPYICNYRHLDSTGASGDIVRN